MQYILQILLYWITIFLIGLIAYPITSRLFSNLSDRGYGLSKAFGLLLLTYIIWILSSFQILSFSRFNLFLIILIFISFYSYSYFKKNNKNSSIKERLKEWIKVRNINLRLIIIEEIVFLVFLTFAIYIRGFNININGTEKFTDFGILNSLLRTQYFPPMDVWFSGSTINYYYFGQLISAVVIKLTDIPSNISYNFSVAYIFAETAIAVFSIVFTLTRNYLYTFFSFLSISIFGNLDIAYKVIIDPQHDIFKLLKTYFFPAATRISPYTIDEFPLYSFFIGDLHAHLLDIPNQLLVIGLVLQIFLIKSSKKLNIKSQKSDEIDLTIPNILNLLKDNFFYIYIIAGSFIIGSMYITNSWDYITYLILFSVATFIYFLINYCGQFRIKIVLSIVSIILTLLLSIIFFLPFFLSFHPPLGGIGINNISHTNVIDFIRTWGYQLFIFLIFLPIIILFGYKKNSVSRKDLFVFLLLIIGIYLIIAPEFVFLKDIYFYQNRPYFRANTTFKFYYQGWIIFGLASGYMLQRFINLKIGENLLLKFLKYSLIGGFSIVTSACILTPVTIFTDKQYSNYLGLNGTSYLDQQHPDTSLAIKWINSNIQGQPVMLEASGDSYSYYSRVSANTGLPTILGWTEHEWGWRYKPTEWAEVLSPRIADVSNIYQGTDSYTVKQLINKYNVQYIFIGDQEKVAYPNIDYSLLNSLGVIVYSNNGVEIIQIS